MSRSQRIFDLTGDSRIIEEFHRILDEEATAARKRIRKLEETLAAPRAEDEDQISAEEIRQLRLECIRTALTMKCAEPSAAADEMLRYVLAWSEPKGGAE